MPAEVAAAAAEVAADAAVEVEGLFEEAVVGREGKDEERAFALGGFGLCCCLLSIDCEGGMGTCGPPQYCSSMHACMHAVEATERTLCGGGIALKGFAASGSCAPCRPSCDASIGAGREANGFWPCARAAVSALSCCGDNPGSV